MSGANAIGSLDRLASSIYTSDQYSVVLLRAFLQQAVATSVAPEAATAILEQLPDVQMPPPSAISSMESALKLAVEIEERELSLSNSDTTSQRGLSVAVYRLGSHYASQGRWPEVETLLRGSLLMDRELHRKNASLESKRDLSITLVGLGDALLLQGQLRDAALLYSESFALNWELYNADNRNFDYAANVYATYIRRGAVAFLEHKFPIARADWNTAVAMIQALREAAPDSRSSDADMVAVNMLLHLVDAADPE